MARAWRLSNTCQQRQCVELPSAGQALGAQLSSIQDELILVLG